MTSGRGVDDWRMPWPEDPLVAAELEAWLERRFPAGGTVEERRARNRRRLRWLVPVAVLVGLAVTVPSFRGYLSAPHGAPTPVDGHPWLFVPAMVLALAACVLPLVGVVKSAGPTKVTRAERAVVSLLTPGERKELRRELLAPEPPTEDVYELDIVARIWWGQRWQPALFGGIGVAQFAGMAFSPLGFVDPLRIATVVLTAVSAAIVVPRARAARSWLRR